MMRIGHGFDAHRFEPGPATVTTIMLGGIAIPAEHGIIAHSDGDVLLHALCDALLGGLALGDIGRHFPDTDDRYRNVDSRVLLREVCKMMREARFGLVNLDLTLILQSPKVSAYVADMALVIADDVGVAADCVNVKATTTENMGFIGRKEGLAAEAVVLMESVSGSA